MKSIPSFSGFPKESITFLRDLSQNNNRAWFHAHYEEYERFVMTPSRSFVVDMGPRIMTLSPYFYADPLVNRSIYRIARDTRRNKDMPPYKEHIGFLFWEGSLPRGMSPGFYVEITGTSIGIASGVYMFTKEMLEEYRHAVVDEKLGKELEEISAALQIKGYPLYGKHYVRTPRGFPHEHPRSVFLLHNTLYSWIEFPTRSIVHKKDFSDFVFAHLKELLPLHEWLMKVLKRVEEKKHSQKFL